MTNTYTYFERTAGGDYNNAADFNQLNENIAAVINTSGTGSPNDTVNSLDSRVTVLEGAGSTSDTKFDFPAGSWDYPSTNFAPWDTDAGSNGNIRRQLFDDTTEEFIEAQIELPSSVSGTVTFDAYGYAVTATASKNIRFKIYHSAKADGENWDAAYATLSSGDLACDGTQDQLDRFTWTDTVSGLGWSANEQVRIKLSRIAPGSDNLSGDYGLTHLRITLPS